jgi:hypothetical protein
VSCFGGSGTYTCVVSGMNTTIISDGVVAFVDLTIAAEVSATTIGLSNTVGSSASGDGIVVLPTGGTVTRGTASSADYGGLDTTTQGAWTGTYGADGYLIANDVSNPPGYAAVSLTGNSLYTWTASTSDPRALQVSSGSSTRIASTYYSYTQFTIDLNLTDGNTHRIALYLLDWSHQSRTETISILDAASGRFLNTVAFSSFSNGQYAVWNLTGHVLIQVQWTGGANAVVSGIFFDPPSSAKYDGLDTTTQGTWTGAYGADGYLIANDVSNPPGYAAVSLTGNSLYTWAASTSDPRALQVSSGSSTRIASTYYSYTQFTIDLNLTDGHTHRIALYLLDWSHQSRTETISILDAASGRFLDWVASSSITNGQYTAWNLTGHVLIQVQWTGGANAVVSGIFFDPPSSAK